MQRIMVERLTASAFAPFGDVIEAREQSGALTINAGTCLKFPGLAMPDCTAEGGQPALHIYHATPLAHPIVITTFERHLLGSQAFMPLSARPYLIVVAPAGEFRREQVQVFRAEGDQGIQYRRGTWHHFCLALEVESAFLVVDRFSAEPDCDEISVPPEQQFTIAL